MRKLVAVVMEVLVIGGNEAQPQYLQLSLIHI